MRQRVGADAYIPDPHTFIVASGDEMPPVLRPDDAIASPDMRPAMISRPGVFALAVFSADANRVGHIQNAQAPRTPSDIPEPDASLRAAAGEDVFVPRAPRHREHGALMPGERMGTGARSEIYEPDGRMLRRARHEEMIRDRRQGMIVYDRVEVEGCGQAERLGGIYFQSVVVRTGEEGLRIERVEGKMGDAELVRRGGCLARFRGRSVDVAIERVSRTLQVP